MGWRPRLRETELSVTTHHHLPQVPTAMALLAAAKKFALEL